MRADWQAVLRACLSAYGHSLVRAELADDDLWTDAQHIVCWVRGENKPFVSPALGVNPVDPDLLSAVALRIDNTICQRSALRRGAITPKADLSVEAVCK